MNTTNFKMIAETLIEDHVSKIESGEIRLGFGNQHDEYVCESALEVLNNKPESVESVAKNFVDADLNNVSAMSLAHALSEFKPDEFSSAWVD